jgi:hypothetical protein
MRLRGLQLIERVWPTSPTNWPCLLQETEIVRLVLPHHVRPASKVEDVSWDFTPSLHIRLRDAAYIDLAIDGEARRRKDIKNIDFATVALQLYSSYFQQRRKEEKKKANTQFAIRNKQYAIRNTQYAIHTQYAIGNMQYAIRNTQYAIRNTQYAIRNMQYYTSYARAHQLKTLLNIYTYAYTQTSDPLLYTIFMHTFIIISCIALFQYTQYIHAYTHATTCYKTYIIEEESWLWVNRLRQSKSCQ